MNDPGKRTLDQLLLLLHQLAVLPRAYTEWIIKFHTHDFQKRIQHRAYNVELPMMLKFHTSIVACRRFEDIS